MVELRAAHADGDVVRIVCGLVIPSNFRQPIQVPCEDIEFVSPHSGQFQPQTQHLRVAKKWLVSYERCSIQRIQNTVDSLRNSLTTSIAQLMPSGCCFTASSLCSDSHSAMKHTTGDVEMQENSATSQDTDSQLISEHTPTGFSARDVIRCRGPLTSI